MGKCGLYCRIIKITTLGMLEQQEVFYGCRQEEKQ